MNFCRFRKTVLALSGGVRVGAGGWGVASSVDMKPTNMHTPRSGFTQTTEYPASSRWTFYDDSTASLSCECEHFSRRGVAAPLSHTQAHEQSHARARSICDRFPRPLECVCMGTRVFYACVAGRTLSDTISNVGLNKDAVITIHANESKFITQQCLTVLEVRPLIGPE